MMGLWIVVLGGFYAPSMLYAQGGAPAQGQFCATYNDDASPEDCSFSTFEMCEQSVSGVGGSCAPSSQAPVMPPPPLIRRDPFAFAPAAVPPPPPMDPAALPMPPVGPPSNGY